MTLQSAILDMPIGGYHSSPRISHSKLRDFASLGPRGYWARYIRGEFAREQTEALLVGQAFEDHLSGRSTFVIAPDGMKFSTKAGKLWREEQLSQGLMIVPASYSAFFEWGKAAIMDNLTARALIEASAEQVTFVTSWSGLPGIQARPDYACEDGPGQWAWRPTFPDLKTTSSLAGFERSIIRYGYHSQAGMVRLASSAGDTSAHPLIVVEKAFPFRCQVFDMSPELIARGESWAREQLAHLAEHYEADEWPRITEDVVSVDVPEWIVEDEQ